MTLGQDRTHTSVPFIGCQWPDCLPIVCKALTNAINIQMAFGRNKSPHCCFQAWVKEWYEQEILGHAEVMPSQQRFFYAHD